MNNLVVTLLLRYSFGVMNVATSPMRNRGEKNDGYYGVVGMATWKASR